VRIGRELHPEQPYSFWDVKVVTTDVRSYLRRDHERYDLIVFGILDSHTALSSLSSLRLDNYVYTMEGIRDALAHLTPDGVMVVSFLEGQRHWLGQRIANVITLANGSTPLSARFNHVAFFVFGPGVQPAPMQAAIAKLGAVPSDYPDMSVRPATDDWPFLYNSPAGQPLVYYLALISIVILGGLGVWAAMRTTRKPGAPKARFDLQMFLLGAGFMLMETKAIAELALLFGSTWIVNTFVFAGIFVMVLLANEAVKRGWGRQSTLAYVLLLMTLAGWYLFPREWLVGFDFGTRVALGTGLVVLPLFFAGIIFAGAFDRRLTPAIAFGSNLVGAVVGGAIEALSLHWGLRSLSLLAMGCYLLSWLAAWHTNKVTAQKPNTPTPDAVPTATAAG
jgi:hypothetical protein